MIEEKIFIFYLKKLSLYKKKYCIPLDIYLYFSYNSLNQTEKITMKYVTKHAKQRMNQRGIKQSMIDLTLEHGEFDHKNRCVLNKKTAIQVMEDLKVTLKTVMKVIDKGGLVVVEESGRVVTTYNYNK